MALAARFRPYVTLYTLPSAEGRTMRREWDMSPCGGYKERAANLPPVLYSIPLYARQARNTSIAALR
jgi:hypothetical protein